MDVNLNSSIKFGGFGTYGLWASEVLLSTSLFSFLHKKSNILLVSVSIGHDGQLNNGNQHSYVRTTQINCYELLQEVLTLHNFKSCG